MKSRKLFLALLIVLIVAVGLVAVACGPDEVPQIPEGPETGTYYYDANNGEYLLTLNSGDKFTLIIAGESKSGKYTLEGTALTLTFNIEEDGTLNAEYVNGTVRMTYEGVSMQFKRKVNYTVTFNSQGGSNVESIGVVNGRSIAKPADPAKEDHVFAGWFKDEACTTPFAFGTEAVTGDVTLYAKWIAIEVGVLNYTVDFDLGYAEAEAIESMQTINGKLYDMAEPSRDGYNFGGWWISDSESRDKLTVRFTEDTVFTQDTTLFAVWNDDQALLPSVTESGVNWNAIPATTSYNVAIYNAANEYVGGNPNNGSQVFAFDWASQPAGEYRIEVSCGNLSATRYYTNKALDRVSLFTVVNNVLTFNAVDNAENYLITVECGNENHVHTLLNNGMSTSYDFTYCPMVEGGIKFTVTAKADGFADSVSRTFVVNRVLDAIAEVVVDEAKETISWSPIAFATGYVVSIVCENSDHDHELVNIGNKTSICYKECSGDLTVNVYPVAKGYNSPECATVEVAKATLATPANIKVNNSLISWDAVAGATAYEIEVNGTAYNASVNNYDLAEIIANAEVGADLVIKVIAKGTKDSLPSDAVTVRNNAMYGTIKYYNNIVSWRHVAGAVRYEVKVNGVIVNEEVVGDNFAEVTLTKAGKNTISVSYFNQYGEQSDEASIDVNAYTVVLNPENGEAAQVIYAALGDNLVLPDNYINNGYTIEGWYNIPGGARANGAEFGDKTLTEANNLSLYANWKPETYTVRFVYGEGEVDATAPQTATVEYGQEEFHFDIPAHVDATMAFVAWTTMEGELSLRVADGNGDSYRAWSIYETDENDEIKLYPIWTKAFIFSNEGNGYSVSKNPVGIHKADILTVPATYNDKPVITIADFAACRNLAELNIPDTVTTVSPAAFDSCDRLNKINVYETTGVTGDYSSSEGVLIYRNDNNEREIAYVPVGAKGTFQVPEGVTSITNVFANKAISEVIIPASVINIRTGAFENCDMLRSVVFEGGSNTLYIEKLAFANCDSLEEITLPARFALSGANFYEVFEGSKNLKNIHVASGHATYMSTDGVVISANREVLHFYPVGRQGSYTVPNMIYEIGDRAFYANPGITEIIVPNRVTKIGKYAFAQCPNLKSVEIGSNVEVIDERAFYQCRALQSVTFNNNEALKTIGDYAFAAYDQIQSYSLTTLKDIRLPQSVETIGVGAFYYQANAIVYLDIPNCTTIGENAFWNSEFSLSTLYSADLSGVTSIGPSAFFNNNGLMIVTINAEETDAIADDAFTRCARVIEVCNTGTMNITAGSSAYGGVAQHAQYVRGASDASRIATTTDGNYTYYSSGSTTYLLKYNGNESNVELPETLGEATSYVIYAAAFLNADFITKLTIPAAVTGIQDGRENANSTTDNLRFDVYPAFYGCTNLREIYNLGSLTLTAGGNDNGYVAKYANEANIYTDVNAESSYVTYEGALFDVKRDGEGVPTTVTLVGLATSESTVVLPNYFVENEVEYNFTLTTSSFNGYTIEHLTVGPGVTAIPDNMFKSNKVIKSFTYNGNGSATIGKQAFYQCTSIETVHVTGVVSIGQQAFASSTSGYSKPTTNLVTLREFTADDALVTIDYMGFFGCPYLETVELGENVVNIYGYGFSYCESLKTITLPGAMGQNTHMGNNTNGTTNYRGNYMFAGCLNLESVVMGEGILALPNYMFQNCKKLTSVSLPDSLVSLMNNVFTGCEALEDIVIPNNVTAIGTNAFDNCYNLRTIVIGEKVEKIGNTTLTKPSDTTSVFSNCRKLREVYNLSAFEFTLGSENHGHIAKFAYVIHDNLNSKLNVTVTDDGYEFCEMNGIAYLSGYNGDDVVLVTPYDYKGGTYEIGPTAFYANDRFVDVTLSANVTAIGNHAFDGGLQGNGKIISVTLNDGLKTIGDYAFNNNVIASVIIPHSVETIGQYAFAINTTMTELVIGNGVTTIGQSAFSAASSLPSVILGTNVTSIGNSAFATCTKLFEVYNLSQLELTPGGTSHGGIAQYAKVVYDSLEAESAFERIDGFVFVKGENPVLINYEGSATTLALPDYQVDGVSVSYTIDAKAFQNNTSIMNVIIPDNVTAIGDYAFENCTALTSVTMGANVATVGAYAFNGCSNLAGNITFGDALTSIGNYAFQNTIITGVTFGANLTSIGNYAFSTTKIGGDLRFPETLTTIGSNVFKATSIKSVIIPNSVTSIGNNAFQNCASLEWAIVGTGISALSQGCFQNCSKLATVVFGANITNMNYYSLTGIDPNVKYFIVGDATADFKVPTNRQGTNYMLNASNRYSYSETEPTEAGKYWHYDENGVPVEW